MKRKSLLVFAATLALAVAIISCGGGQKQETAAPAGGAPAAGGGKAVDAATAGSISGTVKLDGTAPRMKPINMAAEPSCAKEHASSPATTQDVMVGSGGALQNVVVYLKGDFSQYSFEPVSSPAVIDQKGCQYSPHVLAL